MAKIILEQMLKERRLSDKIIVDSAAKERLMLRTATDNARIAIQQLYGKDLLANHKPKSIDEVNLDSFDLILTMEEWHKQGLPKNKTYSLMEYAGLKGYIHDPIGSDLEAYNKCRDAIKDCLDKTIERIISNLS